MDQFENLSQEDAFRKKCLSRARYNMHVKYFDEGANVSLIIPVITKFTPDKKITPFRNSKCKKAECVYDLEELVDRFRSSMYSNYLNFVCFYCRVKIDISDFFFDKSLATVIEQVHNDYNQSRIVCKSIKAFKNGSWEPVVSEYLKQLDEGMSKALDKDKSQVEKKERGIAMLEKLSGSTLNLTSISSDAQGPIFPLIPNYSESELNSLEDKLIGSLAQNDVMTSHYEVAIKFGEYSQMKNEISISFNVMGFFLKYLRKFQQEQKEEFEFTNTKFILIMVKSFDKFYKKVNFLYRKGLNTDAANFNINLENGDERLAIMAYYESHWFLLLCDSNKVGYIVEFLSDDILFLKKADVENMCNSFMETELGFRMVRILWVPVNKLTFMTDCGIYILYYLYKSMTNPDILTIRTKVKEKELFKKQMQWVILKYSKNDKIRGRLRGAGGIAETNMRTPSDSKKSELWPEPKDVWKIKEEENVSGEIDTSNILPKDILNNEKNVPKKKRNSAQKEHLPLIDIKKLVPDSSQVIENESYEQQQQPRASKKPNKPHKSLGTEEKSIYLARPKSILMAEGEKVDSERNNLESKKSIVLPDRISNLASPGMQPTSALLNASTHKSMLLSPSKSILTPASALKKNKNGMSSISHQPTLTTKRSVYIPKLNLQNSQDFVEEGPFLQLDQNQLLGILNDFKEKVAERARLKLLLQKAEEEEAEGNLIYVDNDRDEIVLGRNQLKILLRNKEELMKLDLQGMRGQVLANNNIPIQPYGMPPPYFPYPNDYDFSMEDDEDDENDEEEDDDKGVDEDESPFGGISEDSLPEEKPKKRRKKKKRSLSLIDDVGIIPDEGDESVVKKKGKKGKKKKKKKKKQQSPD